MAKHITPRRSKATLAGIELDVNKFENIHQIAGIQIAQLAPGTANATKVALVNTGSGLRFTIALDRGGDIVDASFNQYNLAYLTSNGIKPPSQAYNVGFDWLRGWPGGLLTTCGPQHIGAPRVEDGVQTALHGHHSNTPANVVMLINPDPHHGRNEMLISMTISDTCMFGAVLEVQRTIQCIVGQPQIQLYDQVINRGNIRSAHNWLYHINLGYPLLDRGAQLVYRGPADYFCQPELTGAGPTDAALNQLKKVTDPLPAHVGTGERGLIVQVETDRQGNCHAGLINRRLGLAFEVTYPSVQLPRMVNWQHYGPQGSYVTGVEPFSGSLMGKDNDAFRGAVQYLEPGQKRRYQLTLQVHEGERALASFAQHDGKVYQARPERVKPQKSRSKKQKQAR